MVVLRKKLNGATLIEVLIALSVFTVCLSIGSLTLARVTKSGNRQKKLQADVVVSRIAALKPDTFDYINGSIFINDLLIEKKLSPSIHSSRLLVVEYTVKDDKGRFLTSIRRIILRDYEEELNP